MIDIKRIREEKEGTLKALQKRICIDSLDDIIDLDNKRKYLCKELSELQGLRNKASKEIAIMKKNNQDITEEIVNMKKVNAKITSFNKMLAEIEKQLTEMLSSLPNIPDADVLPGGKENNEVVFTYGTKPQFDFTPIDHVSLATKLEMIDFERGVKLGGQGSWIYTGIGAQLEWALLNYFINSHLSNGWNFMLVPHMLTYECGYTAGQFPKFRDEVYWLDGKYRMDGKFMLPTAETALVNLHRNEILSVEQLPKKYFAYTPCYRREAGSSRIEERGTIRGHQFNKVEMVQYTTEDKSDAAFLEMLENAQKLVQNLGLHYQVSKLAAGDCSASMCRTYDIEIWIPSMEIYKEVSSVSNSRDYQARRGNMKYRDTETGKLKYMHTLNASGLATSRLLPAILEQYQLEDGSILIPEVLRPYMGGIDKITMPPKSKIRTLKNK